MTDENAAELGAMETIQDEWGVLHRVLTKRGWLNVKRELNGRTINLRNSKTSDYIEALMASGVQLRLNDMNDRVEVDGKGVVTDIQLAVILNRLRDMGLTGEVRMQDALKEAAHRARYHPIKEFFDGLPEWDGVDHVSKFLAYFTFAPDHAAVGETFFRHWLIGCVTKILFQEQTYMLVLDGGQGIGKSFVSAWLCSPIPHMHTESTIRPDSNDSQLRKVSFWIWEAGELQAITRKSDVEGLKHFITEMNVVARQPYARADMRKPATVNFMGTINENGAGFLQDMTGNRRFAVVKVLGIDWAYSTEVDLLQMWSQLVSMAKNGARAELPVEIKAAQHQINKEYEVISATIELFLNCYEVDHACTTPIKASDIMVRLKDNGLTIPQRAAIMEVATYLQAQGVTKKRTMAGTVYSGLREVFGGNHADLPV